MQNRKQDSSDEYLIIGFFIKCENLKKSKG